MQIKPARNIAFVIRIRHPAFSLEPDRLTLIAEN